VPDQFLKMKDEIGVKAKDAVLEKLQSISSVSEENSAAAEEISASAEELTASTEEIAANAQEVLTVAKRLEEGSNVSRSRPEKTGKPGLCTRVTWKKAGPSFEILGTHATGFLGSGQGLLGVARLANLNGGRVRKGPIVGKPANTV